MKKDQTVFNFQDGLGEVPAHRHINKNGDEGGWVADTVKVEDSVYVYGRCVGLRQCVWYTAMRRSPAMRGSHGNAQVSGNAWVYGNARVSGNARLRVSGDARVSGNA